VGAARPGFSPAACNGGVGATQATHALIHIDRWLAEFPGRFVTLNFGSNHAGVGCGADCADAFEAEMRSLIQTVLAAGKLPVIPRIPWSRNSQWQADLPVLNARIDALYAEFPQVVRGPDLWTFFQANPSLISSDDLHPTAEGYFRLKQVWAETMAAPGGPYGP
jgi:lysophospholipase L1-like esterase